MAFSQETLDFLSQNFMNNSRDWYQSHKDEYRKFVAEPFTEFITKLEPALHAIDGQMLVDPRKFSRLFRDMRYVKGGPIFHRTAANTDSAITTPQRRPWKRSAP